MKSFLTPSLLALLAVAAVRAAMAQGTAFTYQGKLDAGSQTASGSYDLQFTIYDAASGGNVVAGPLTKSPTLVTSGLFTVTLDFGDPFDGNARWLEIGVRTNGSASFTTLTPRQELTPTPYAIFAAGASNVFGVLASGGLDGNYPAALTFTNPANNFGGNGSGLAGVNAVTVGGLRASQFWQLNGNGGTTGGINFLGTTDNQPLELHVNGSRALRLEPGSGLPNVIGGAANNSILAGVLAAVVGGGAQHTNASSYSAIGGGQANSIGTGADHSFIGGGDNNKIQFNSLQSFIGSGQGNVIQHDAGWSAISGGVNNQIYSGWSAIGGGTANTVLPGLFNCTIGGGAQNTNNGSYGTIGGGLQNGISGVYGTIGGGQANSCGGAYAAVAGGIRNRANGDYSFAAGQNANALHPGAFVWADASSPAPFSSTAANQFLIHATGGVGIGTADPLTALHVLWPGDCELSLQSSDAVNSHRWTLQSSGGNQLYPGTFQIIDRTAFAPRFLIDTNGNVGIGTRTPQFPLHVNGSIGWGGSVLTTDQSGAIELGDSTQTGSTPYIDFHYGVGSPQDYSVRLMNDAAGQLTCYGTFRAVVLMVTSDRHAKENFETVNPRDVLAKVAALPMTSWNFKTEPAHRHIGPMAQDFFEAFSLGSDDKHIATVDEEGVALAAIQGLNQKLDEKDSEILELKRDVRQLKELVSQLTGAGSK